MNGRAFTHIRMITDHSYFSWPLGLYQLTTTPPWGVVNLSLNCGCRTAFITSLHTSTIDSGLLKNWREWLRTTTTLSKYQDLPHKICILQYDRDKTTKTPQQNNTLASQYRITIQQSVTQHSQLHTYIASTPVHFVLYSANCSPVYLLPLPQWVLGGTLSEEELPRPSSLPPTDHWPRQPHQRPLWDGHHQVLPA